MRVQNRPSKRGILKKNIKTNDGGPFGAVIVKSGKIVGLGNNQVIKTNDPTAHAEIIAIRNACKNLSTYDLSECELFTSCYPCPMCLSAIIWANIKTVYYGNTKEDADKLGFRDDIIYEFLKDLTNNNNNSNILNMIPIDREITIKTFNEFENKTENKTIY